uniref:Uncharacterized protein n=1 Tax=Arundo donax TaxID=35708 RepID=A0A0A9QQ09_ARUDO
MVGCGWPWLWQGPLNMVAG